MKTNVKFVVWSFAVVPFVVAATVAVLCSLEQNDSANYKLGPVNLSELNFVVGGSGEGTNCYTISTNACPVSSSDKAYCDNGDIDDLECPSTGKVYSGNPTFSFRTTDPSDMPNTLGKKTHQVNCYTPYVYHSISYVSYMTTHGYSCSQSDSCINDYDNKDSACMTCYLTVSGPIVQVDSSSCEDP